MSGEGAVRAAAAVLQSSGGGTVYLRLPAPAVSGSDAEQLGLTSPLYEDVPLQPAAWRTTGQGHEVLVAAEALTPVLSLRGLASVDSLVQSALGVAADGLLYAITGCERVMVAETPCAYRLLVQEPAWA
jgi:hypothetical protein